MEESLVCIISDVVSVGSSFSWWGDRVIISRIFVKRHIWKQTKPVWKQDERQRSQLSEYFSWRVISQSSWTETSCLLVSDEFHLWKTGDYCPKGLIALQSKSSEKHYTLFFIRTSKFRQLFSGWNVLNYSVVFKVLIWCICYFVTSMTYTKRMEWNFYINFKIWGLSPPLKQ